MMSWLAMCYDKNLERATVIQKACTDFAPIAAHLGSKNFMQGSEVTMVDFLMFDLVETIEALCQDDRLLQQYQNLAPYMTRMRALPNFKDYLSSTEIIRAPFFGNPAIKIAF